MAFSATTTSVATGNWGTAGTWDNGVPDVDDHVLITGGFTVTLAAAGTFADLYVDGGVLALGYGGVGNTLTVKDAAGAHATGAHIRIGNASGSGWNSNSVSTSNKIVSQNTGAPTYRIKVQIDTATGSTETRTMDFSFMDFADCACYLGDATYGDYVWFNTGNVTTNGFIEQPAPVSREQKLDVHYIAGRDKGRVYHDGGHAGTTTLNGLIPWESYDWQMLCDMRDARRRVAFQGQYVVLHSARIEALQFGRRAGPYVPFSMTLIEDL